MTPTIGEEADWDDALGRACMVKVYKEKGVYDAIDKDLAPIPTKHLASVPEGEITPCTGDADDENNAATAALRGLTRYKWKNRLLEEDVPF